MYGIERDMKTLARRNKSRNAAAEAYNDYAGNRNDKTSGVKVI